MASNILPHSRQPVVSPDGLATREFYRFFSSVAQGGGTSPQLAIDIAALQQQIASIPKGGSADFTLLGQNSITYAGTPASDLVTLQLDGDVAAPDPLSYYGTDADGTRSYFTVASAAYPVMKAALVPGANVTITPDDIAQTLTIAASGSASSHYDGGNAASVYTLAQHTFNGGGANG